MPACLLWHLSTLYTTHTKVQTAQCSVQYCGMCIRYNDTMTTSSITGKVSVGTETGEKQQLKLCSSWRVTSTSNLDELSV